MAGKFIKFYITDEQYDYISDKANKENKSLSAYSKDIILSKEDMFPITIQTEDLFEHSKQIELCRQDLNKLITNDLRYKEVYKEDIKKMMTMLNNIEEAENVILSSVLTTRKKIKQETIKLLKQRGGENGNHKNTSNK